jgi:hypothetical protein
MRTTRLSATRITTWKTELNCRMSYTTRALRTAPPFTTPNSRLTSHNSLPYKFLYSPCLNLASFGYPDCPNKQSTCIRIHVRDEWFSSRNTALKRINPLSLMSFTKKRESILRSRSGPYWIEGRIFILETIAHSQSQ